MLNNKSNPIEVSNHNQKEIINGKSYKNTNTNYNSKLKKFKINFKEKEENTKDEQISKHDYMNTVILSYHICDKYKIFFKKVKL